LPAIDTLGALLTTAQQTESRDLRRSWLPLVYIE